MFLKEVYHIVISNSNNIIIYNYNIYNLWNIIYNLKFIVYICHGAHTREEQEHADEDINSNYNI